MSATCLLALFELPENLRRWRTPQQLALLAVLANFHNDKRGYAWPSVDTIAALLKVTRRHAIRLLKDVERLGLVDIEPGGGRGTSNRYRLLKPEPINSDLGVTVSTATTWANTVTEQSPRGDLRVTVGVTSPSGNGDAGGTKTVTPASPELSTEHGSSERVHEQEGNSARARDQKEQAASPPAPLSQKPKEESHPETFRAVRTVVSYLLEKNGLHEGEDAEIQFLTDAHATCLEAGIDCKRDAVIAALKYERTAAKVRGGSPRPVAGLTIATIRDNADGRKRRSRRSA